MLLTSVTFSSLIPAYLLTILNLAILICEVISSFVDIDMERSFAFKSAIWFYFIFLFFLLEERFYLILEGDRE